MGERLYVTGIITVWVISMSWLVTERILPPFYMGHAPSSQSLNQEEPIAWDIQADGKPCGFAIVQAVKRPDKSITVYSLISLESVPWPKSAPIWITALKNSLKSLSIDIRTQLSFDPTKQLTDFETKFLLFKDAQPVTLKGWIEGNQLKLTVRAASITKSFEHTWPEKGMLASEMMPESKLIGVYPGKTWQKEVFSPLASPHNPIQLLEAKVAPFEYTQYEGKTTRVNPVEFRTPERVGTTDAERLRSRLLVTTDGQIIQQELYFLGSCLKLIRLDEEASQEIATAELKLGEHSPEAAIPRKAD